MVKMRMCQEDDIRVSRRFGQRKRIDVKHASTRFNTNTAMRIDRNPIQ